MSGDEHENENKNPEETVPDQEKAPTPAPHHNYHPLLVGAVVVLGIMVAVQAWYMYGTALSRVRENAAANAAYCLTQKGNDTQNGSADMNTTLGKWSYPFSELRTFERLLDNFMGQPAISQEAYRQMSTTQFKMDVQDKGPYYLITADMPGVQKDDIAIGIDNGILTIQAERKTNSTDTNAKKQYYRQEIAYGAFERSFVLPRNVDTQKVKADYENGVLRITISKKEAAAADSTMVPVRMVGTRQPVVLK